MLCYPCMVRRYAEKRSLINFAVSDNGPNIRPAFQNCLAAYCATTATSWS